MKFEVSDKSTETRGTWDEALMYCFSLGPGWRLPTVEEFDQMFAIRHKAKWWKDNNLRLSWYWSADRNSVYSMLSGKLSVNFVNSTPLLIRAVRDL